MAKPPPLSLVAKALLAAASRPVSAAAMALVLAQSIAAEGAWASWNEGGADLYPFEGTNNFGAIHATQKFAAAHADGGGFGMVAFLDRGAGPYIARMSVYPSLA
jgi:hypothetical protein